MTPRQLGSGNKRLGGSEGISERLSPQSGAMGPECLGSPPLMSQDLTPEAWALCPDFLRLGHSSHIAACSQASAFCFFLSNLYKDEYCVCEALELCQGKNHLFDFSIYMPGSSVQPNDGGTCFPQMLNKMSQTRWLKRTQIHSFSPRVRSWVKVSLGRAMLLLKVQAEDSPSSWTFCWLQASLSQWPHHSSIWSMFTWPSPLFLCISCVSYKVTCHCI